jgi:hypothetical protein
VSIKKLQFYSDFACLNRWGAEGASFLALVDFDGRLLAAPLSDADLRTGKVDLPVGRLHFQFYNAVQNDVIAMDFHPM